MKLELNKLVEVAYPGEPQIFTNEQLIQINKLIKYDDYYRGKAFKYIADKYPEYSDTQAKDYKPTQVPLNYARYIINKQASWQFEIPIDFDCTSESEEEIKKVKKAKGTDIGLMRSDEIEKDIYDSHKKNLMDAKLFQAAVECNTSGGVVFKLKYDLNNSQVKIMPRPRIECFPIYEFDDYENMIRVHFVAYRDENTIWKQTYELATTPEGKKICYIFEALYDVKDVKIPKEVIIEYQPLGFNKKWLDFIPVYIIPNCPIIGEEWGTSELEDLIPIFDEIDKKYSDMSDSLKFDMFAITIFLNAKIPTGSDGKMRLKNKANSAWDIVGLDMTSGIKPEVFKLQSLFQYIETLKYHLDSLQAKAFEFSEVVNLSVDKISGLSALSGVALKLLFASIISKTNRKNTIWAAKLREMYLGILKMKRVYEGYEIPDDLDIEIIFHDPLPQNELEQVQVIAAKIADGLISTITAMNEIGVENPEEELAKVLAERKSIDEVMNPIVNRTEPAANE